jgi:hypothetical protein
VKKRAIQIRVSPEILSQIDAYCEVIEADTGFKISRSRATLSLINAGLNRGPRAPAARGCISCNAFWKKETSAADCKRFACACACHTAEVTT